MQQRLRSAFLDALPEELQAGFAAVDSLGGELEELAGAAAAAREARGGSSDSFEPEAFAAAIAERMSPDAAPARALSHVRADELELALACAAGDSAAILALERRYFGEVEAALSRLRLDKSRLDEVKQTLRASLFVATEDKPAKVAGYSGRGSLGRWLCVTAVRIELMARRARKPEVGDDGLIGALPAPADTPELEHLKAHYREQFQDAFGVAMSCLDERQRVLLKQHYLDGLNIDRLGALYGVHRATAARWVARARQTVYESTRDAMRSMLDVNDKTYESILRLIQSQLDFSIRSHLE